MSNKDDANTLNKEEQNKKKPFGNQSQFKSNFHKTPYKNQNEELHNQIFNLMSPFKLPPKFNPQYTATSLGNHTFSHDMKVIETPFHQRHNPYRSNDIEEINEDLRRITGKIDWGNTPVKSDQSSSSYEEGSQHASSSQIIPEQNEDRSQQDQISISQKQQKIPQKQIVAQVENNIQLNVDRQQSLVPKRITHHKKHLDNFSLPEPNIIGKKVFCNCKKTKCLKLYCDCFRINQTCDGCNCQGCHNLGQFIDQRNNAILVLMDRNPDPFSQKIHDQMHLKGCNCKKSFCLKKYCECYQASLKCGQNCKCDQCKNGGGSENRQKNRIQKLLINNQQQIDVI